MTPTQALIVAGALLSVLALIVAGIVWAIARDGRDDDECDELHFTFLPDDDATDDIWDLAAALGYDEGWCGRCGRHITECRADGSCAAALVDFDDLVPPDARYCPRHADDTITLFRVPDDWTPPIGKRRIRLACDTTQPMPAVQDDTSAAPRLEHVG